MGVFYCHSCTTRGAQASGNFEPPILLLPVLTLSILSCVSLFLVHGCIWCAQCAHTDPSCADTAGAFAAMVAVFFTILDAAVAVAVATSLPSRKLSGYRAGRGQMGGCSCDRGWAHRWTDERAAAGRSILCCKARGCWRSCHRHRRCRRRHLVPIEERGWVRRGQMGWCGCDCTRIQHGWMRDAAGRLELCMLQDLANAVVVGFACSIVSH